MHAYARPLCWLLVSLIVLLGPGTPSASAEPEWLERQTEHLVLRYTAGDEAEVGWYGEFVEDIYRQVSDIFGQEGRPGIVVTFYPDEAAYAVANPLARGEDGVLAHARPLTREVGLALERLRKQSELLRRDAVRHELTHIVLADLSDNKLPIGFQEGLAQAVEQDGEQRAKLARILRRGAEVGQLLTFADLNRQRTFLARASIAYPESYAMVQFLSEHYGFGHLVRMVGFLREEQGLDEAVRRAFGRSLEQLEVEWQAALPRFLDGGGSRNDLDLWELGEPRRLFAEGNYAGAREGFERASRLFGDLGRAEKLEQARMGLRQSSDAIEAVELGRRGSTALEGHDYKTASDLLGRSETLWSVVGDEGRHDLVRTELTQAQQGIEAMEQLEQAKALVGAWRLPEARETALAAGRSFVDLGDAERTAEANLVLDEAQALQNRLAIAALGGGSVGLAAIGLAWGLSRRPRRPMTPTYPARPALAAREHDWSL